MKSHQLGVLALAAAISCGVLSSCSSSGGSSSGSGGGTAVPIGVIGAFAGPVSSLGGVPKVLDAWEKTINAAGGVNGQKVHLITKEVGNATGAGLTAVKAMITENKVAAILDFDTAGDTTWLSYAAAQKVPVLLGAPSGGALVSSNAFPATVTPLAIGYGLAATAKLAGPKLGIAYCAETSGCGQLTSTISIFGASQGVTVPVSLKVSSSAPDYTAQCEAMKQGGVNSYILTFAPSTSNRITDACYKQGLRIPQVLLGPNATSTWKKDGAFDGDYVLDAAAPYFLTSTPAQKQYRAALTKFAPSIPNSDLDNSSSEFGWIAGQLFKAAASHVVGKLTAASVTRGLYALKNETLGGLVPPLNYVQGKVTSVNCYYVWRVSGGKFTAPNGNKYTCASESAIAPLAAAAEKAAGVSH